MGDSTSWRVGRLIHTLNESLVPMSGHQLARDVGISSSAAHRLLHGLVEAGVVRQVDGGWVIHLTPGVRDEERSVDVGRLIALARPGLIDLTERSGHTTTLSTLVDLRRVYVAQEVARRAARVQVDMTRSYALYAGASGKAILAYLPTPSIRHILSGELRPITDQTITDPEKLLEQLESIRRNGVAYTQGERWKGLCSIACPIFGPEGRVVGSASVSAPVEGLPPAEVNDLGKRLQSVTESVSKSLGEG